MHTPSWKRPVPAALLALSLGATGVAALNMGSASAAPKDKSDNISKKLRAAITADGVGEHLEAFQGIADANDGSRGAGTPGYAASRDYVVQRLRDAGYKPRVQSFQFPYFAETAPPVLAQVTPDETTYTSPEDFSTMTFSGSGDVTAEVVAVDTDASPSDTSTSGCEAADFAGFTAGSIALIQRGTCPFGDKAANAEAAGAAGVIIFNRGTAGGTEAIAGTLGGAGFGIPVVGTSYDVGVDLADPAGTTAHLATTTESETRTTWNVTAETKGGDAGNVVMAGAHLDSVVDGPGINDNGSGSGALLEVAEEAAKLGKKGFFKQENKVRFAWWGAEELGLLGSEHYVTDLAANNPGALEDIALYLNFDMVGSPNYVRFIYDGDNSKFGEDEGAAIGPEGSGDIEQVFTDYFAGQQLASAETPFSGRSDYGPFIAEGIASGGLFTGAEGLKTEEEAAIFGGEAGVAYDECYHQPCDDIDNISTDAIDEMSDAVAHAIAYYAHSTSSLSEDSNKARMKKGKSTLRVAERTGQHDPKHSHQARR